ncbi:DNA (cytosine-5)-methyltransferase 1 [Lachnospiraceae bacterium NLAE-zl-G231]|nr:DNA (cytosine-5)-methyltransferase 1 [Lachnospiraceae bacterium NLAE-zl-G231]
MANLRYLDLFAGAGGLSEGFIRAGFMPVSHVEMDTAACYTLKTRLAYKWLQKQGREQVYNDYLNGDLSRAEFYAEIPDRVLSTVLNYEISWENIEEIFKKVDENLHGKKIDLIVGGPPCQAYSLIGRARDENSMLGDKRNYLYILYGEFLKKYKPKYFVFENVLGLLSAKDTDELLHFDKMRNLFKECGYKTEFRQLNAADYGVLQNRKRIILIGKYGTDKEFYPDIPQEERRYMVEEIFSDLPHLQAGQGQIRPVETLDYRGTYLYESGIKQENCQRVTFHSARPNTEQDREIYRIAVTLWDTEQQRLSYVDLPEHLRTQQNMDSFLDRFKVVASNVECSQTVVAHVAKDGHYFIHPDIQQNRSLTPRELARLQTFPDDYFFESMSGKPSRTSAFKQIGNAVPVCLSEKVARALRKAW